MACGGLWRPYSSFQYRAGALVAVVGRHTLAPSVSTSPVHRAECHEDTQHFYLKAVFLRTLVSWTRHSAAPCICWHGPASLSSPRARGIAYTFVAIETYPHAHTTVTPSPPLHHAPRPLALVAALHFAPYLACDGHCVEDQVGARIVAFVIARCAIELRVNRVKPV